MSEELLTGLTKSVSTFKTERMKGSQLTVNKSKKGSIQTQYAALEKQFLKETSDEST